MTDETTGATETQADSETQPPAGSSATQADAEGGEQQAHQPESISLEEAKKLRAESNSLRRRLKELEDRTKADEDAKLSETERLTKRAAELEQQLADRDRALRERAVRYATVATAARLGFADPEDAIRLIDQDAIEFDDAGDARNIGDLLGALAKAKPYLLSGARTAGSFDTGTGGGRQAGPRTYTREQLRDPEFFAKNREDILRAMNEGRVTA